MEDISVITQLIGSLGFPIVACGYMMVTNTKVVKENTEATNKMVALVEKLLDHMNHKEGE